MNGLKLVVVAGVPGGGLSPPLLASLQAFLTLCTALCDILVSVFLDVSLDHTGGDLPWRPSDPTVYFQEREGTSTMWVMVESPM